LQDLKDQRIRTPIDPTKTFFDDPLRILRVFRFAARFGFQVDPETMKS
jgi:tRNA nucleotidyltransferase (CCA-adding enzyme)